MGGDELIPGCEKAWDELLLIDPGDVSKRAEVRYRKESREYLLRSFNSEFIISLDKREIKPTSESDFRWLPGIEDLFELSALQYLIRAKSIEPSGRLINPGDFKGGDIFFRGSHVLPLDPIARKYSKSPKDFILAGELLGGRVLSLGDAAIELRSFPRTPLTFILWKEDEEFPARLSLLFDSTAEQHLPLDILWAIALISVRAFHMI